jgi:hypothetical protein
MPQPASREPSASAEFRRVERQILRLWMNLSKSQRDTLLTRLLPSSLIHASRRTFRPFVPYHKLDPRNSGSTFGSPAMKER